jgi:periplasmic protein CpxP/Spy
MRSLPATTRNSAHQHQQGDKQQMKNTFLTLALASGLALGGATALQAHPGHEGREGGKRIHKMKVHGVEHLTKNLNLTPEQEAQIRPIVEQTKPQMKAIMDEAMQKRKALMEQTAAQIRPLLTPEQQQKFDSLRAAQEKMREARKEMREARRGQ